ncbi:hypothetical protein [Amphritea pacifica]|uniref:NADH-rubredoxin oxidoreductase C-terminal domain-containing protein n=1 Tax=Amphritea pacifica TaxID=2811233 RepID=A0ABS2WDY3_9GAMM|nr:hypothetical protein [Amphritea pacifica]MBN0989835.1 hypothetical protein [Amphritea pacifica]MBN1006603.1 hypothetical protein [Amphritea pacifica]
MTKLKVSGLDIHSIGAFETNANDPEKNIEVMKLSDTEHGIYKKLVLQNNHIIGAVCVGDVSDSFWYHQLMTEKTDIQAFRSNLLLGKAYSDVA